MRHIYRERVFHKSFKRFQSNDLYKVLGVDSNISESELKKKYFELAKKYHPDINPSNDAKKKFVEINNAYEILSDKQKRAQYDATRIYGQSDFPDFSRNGSQTYGQQPPKYGQRPQQAYQRERTPESTFEDMLKFWNEMVKEEQMRNSFQTGGRTTKSSFQTTTIRRDPYGNIRVETRTTGGGGNTFDWQQVRRAEENLKKARGSGFDNPFGDVFQDPWKIFQGRQEKPTLLEFPSSFSVLQSLQPNGKKMAQFEIGSRSKHIGSVAESSLGQLTFTKNGAAIAKARFWYSTGGENGTIEDPSGKKIATISQTNNFSPSLISLVFPSMISTFVVKNNQDKPIGYITNVNYIFSRISFYSRNRTPVVRVKGAINFFGINFVEYCDVSIGIDSTFDPSILVLFTVYTILKRQRSPLNVLEGVGQKLKNFFFPENKK